MWACALGHLDAALLLYRWNQRALAIPDSLGRLPLAVARSRGHVALATRLEDLQRAEAETPGPLNAGAGKAWPPLRIASPLSASPDTGTRAVGGRSGRPGSWMGWGWAGARMPGLSLVGGAVGMGCPSQVWGGCPPLTPSHLPRAEWGQQCIVALRALRGVTVTHLGLLQWLWRP